MTLLRKLLSVITVVVLLVSLAVLVPRDNEVVKSQAVASDIDWNGDFDLGGVPHGSNGPDCNTGDADGPDSAADQYDSIQEDGNTNCTNKVEFTNEKVRTPDSKRSMKITMGPNQKREVAQSTYRWSPDSTGKVDQYYAWSWYFDPATWGDYKNELSGSDWDSPVAWRTDGANGSMDISTDTNDSNGVSGEAVHSYADGPHWSLRRNTVKANAGFFTDGLGYDKIDLGPVVVGKWVDFVCHIRWSTTTNGALRECWRDGTKMGPTKTSLNAVDTLPHKFRIGHYQNTTINHSRISWFDNVRIGGSYAAVDPSVDRSTGTTPTPTPTATPTPTPTVTPTPTQTPTPTPTVTPTPTPTATATPTTPPPAGSVAFSSAKSGTDSDTSVNVSTPTGAVGSATLIGISVRGNPTITPPSGWTQVLTNNLSSTIHQAVFKREYPAAGGGANIVFTLSSAQNSSWQAVNYNDATVGTSAGATSSSSTPSVPAITGAPGGKAVAFVGVGTISSVTPGSGYTERTQVSSPTTATYKVTGESADKTIPSTGTVSATPFTLSPAAGSVEQVVELH